MWVKNHPNFEFLPDELRFTGSDRLRIEAPSKRQVLRDFNEAERLRHPPVPRMAFTDGDARAMADYISRVPADSARRRAYWTDFAHDVSAGRCSGKD